MEFDDKLIEGLPNDNMVEKIRMNCNRFTRADFMHAHSLKELYLNHNKIVHLHIGRNYPSLGKLSLIGNQLEILDFTKLDLPCLEILDLCKLTDYQRREQQNKRDYHKEESHK
jgi:Leucine-rich repeat (LRR) protein